MVTATANPVAPATSVTFSATVSPTNSGGATPTGSVVFTIGSNPPTSSIALNGAGVAQYVTSFSPRAPVVVQAAYSGDTTYSGSQGQLTETVSSVGPNVAVTMKHSDPFTAGGDRQLHGVRHQ